MSPQHILALIFIYLMSVIGAVVIGTLWFKYVPGAPEAAHDLDNAVDDLKTVVMREMVEPWAVPICNWLARVLKRFER